MPAPMPWTWPGKTPGGLSLQVEFRQASWLADSEGRYDLIVSNPPYVAAQTTRTWPR